MKKLQYILLLIIFCSASNSSIGKISEKELSQCSSLFIAKLIEFNPDSTAEINRYMNGYIKDGNASMRLLDKFGIFLFNSRENGIALHNIHFYASGNSLFSLYIVLRDKKDDQLYTMFMEYEYQKKGRQCILRDIYFSIVFNERLNHLKKFFQQR